MQIFQMMFMYKSWQVEILVTSVTARQQAIRVDQHQLMKIIRFAVKNSSHAMSPETFGQIEKIAAAF